MRALQSPQEFSAPPLFVFDLDSTVTGCELLPRLARAAGVEAEMRLRTERCMAGDSSFAQDFPSRVEMLSALPLSRAREIAAGIPLNPRIAEFLRAHPQRSMILTGNLDVWIAPILERLNMAGRCLSSRARVEGDRVCGVACLLDKDIAAQTLPRPFIAIGDGDNDVGMLRAANLSIAFGGVRRPASRVIDAAQLYIQDEAALCALLARYL